MDKYSADAVRESLLSASISHPNVVVRQHSTQIDTQTQFMWTASVVALDTSDSIAPPSNMHCVHTVRLLLPAGLLQDMRRAHARG